MQTNGTLLANPQLSGVTVLDGGLTTTPATPTTITTAGAGTYSVDAIASGCILRDCAGANRTDTTATATALVAGLPLDRDGATHQCIVVNTSDAAETITLAGGSGVTITGSIAQGQAILLTFIRVSATAIVVQGTSVTPGTLSGNQTITGNLAVGGTLDVTGLTTLDDKTVTGIEKTALSTTAATIDTAGAGTYTAANLATGRILRDCAGAGRTDTTDTAANLITGLSLSADYQERYCELVNTSSAAETVALAGGSGVTLKGTITVAQNEVTRLAIMRTGAGAVCIREV